MRVKCLSTSSQHKSVIQRQTAVTAYFICEQLPLFVFAPDSCTDALCQVFCAAVNNSVGSVVCR